MHMADALISPAVGGTMWTVALGLIVHSSKKIKENFEDRKVPLMGVLGAFIFATQMINFTIPGTGSSGHLGGGMILSILLGPHAAFLAIASVLTVQALFFADGGLLALGCNIFNLGFFPAYVTFPLIYKKITRIQPNHTRLVFGALLAAFLGLQLGAFCVVLETFFSGISELPFGTFVLLMQPIHMAIGVVEGLVTASVVVFVWKARPELVEKMAFLEGNRHVSIAKIITGIVIVTILTGGIVSWFASNRPDGLEWSILNMSGREELAIPPKKPYEIFGNIQQKTAFLPNYNFRESEEIEKSDKKWPAIDSATTISGLLGAIFSMTIAAVLGWGLRRWKNSPDG